VVISVPERTAEEKYAAVTAASRELADIYGLRVIIDGSPNSIPPNLKTTNREVVIDIERMSRDVIEKIPEFEDLISFLQKHHLDDGVWEMFGGTPSHYIQLRRIKAQFSDSQTDSIIEAIKGYAHSHLLTALNDHIGKSSPNTKAIIRVLREKKTTKIPFMILEAQGLLLDYPNKVFREVNLGDDIYVIPSTPAVSLIISNSITNGVEVEKLWTSLFSKKA
jgi:predicted Zn-dependent protease with MMP-like domain